MNPSTSAQEEQMKTIRAIFRDGTLKPLDPIDLPDNTPVTVALLDDDDLSADAIARLAPEGRTFDFLDDPREDIYLGSDGEAV
jgi:predicted DNA-binding antitoxin AbrB/MazE fold protein